MNSIRVVHFSDTHLGEFFSIDQLKTVVEKINKQSPDLVIFTGDLFDIMIEYENIDAAISELNKINASFGKIAIMGNRDFQKGEEYYIEIMKNAGFKVLVNDVIQLSYKDQIISIYGINKWNTSPSELTELMSGINKDHINLLLMHEPDLMNNFINYPIDLALAGHSHGGQVYIPLVGPLIKTNLCEDFIKGKYDLKNERNTIFYVSSGIGNTKVPFRFCNIPEFITFELKF